MNSFSRSLGFPVVKANFARNPSSCNDSASLLLHYDKQFLQVLERQRIRVFSSSPGLRTSLCVLKNPE